MIIATGVHNTTFSKLHSSFLVAFSITGYYDHDRPRHADSQDTDLSCHVPNSTVRGDNPETHRPNFYPAETMLEATEVARRQRLRRRSVRTGLCLNIEALCQSRSLSERTPVNHPYTSPCMVTVPATERYATTSRYRRATRRLATWRRTRPREGTLTLTRVSIARLVAGLGR